MRYKIIILCLLISMSAALQADVTHSEKTQAWWLTGSQALMPGPRSLRLSSAMGSSGKYPLQACRRKAQVHPSAALSATR